MATSLIMHKRIKTTLAKAKALRVYVEPIITRAKDDSDHARRVVFSYLQNKEVIKELFGIVREKVGERPGGYTRILRTGFRLGDNAEMCMIELVDFNENMLDAKSTAKEVKKPRRTRRSSKKSVTEEVEPKPAKEKATTEAVVEKDSTTEV